jgi:hypothetical protein
LQTLIGGPKLDSLLRLLAKAPLGDLVELGVYHGGTLKAMAEKCPDRTCYGFDTFEGLPAESWREGEPHGVGDFRDCDFESVRTGMPPNVILRRGYFPSSAHGVYGPIAFAHVDFDFEVSTTDAIEWLKPRMTYGAIMVFDDYQWQNCPGVERAILKARLEVRQSAPNQCYWVKDD